MTTLFDPDQLRGIADRLEKVNDLFEQNISGPVMIEFPESFEVTDANGIYLGSFVFEEEIFVFAPDEGEDSDEEDDEVPVKPSLRQYSLIPVTSGLLDPPF
jgi:hypothetical protein